MKSGSLFFIVAVALWGDQNGVDAFLEPAIVETTYTFLPESKGVFLPFQRSAYADTQVQVSIGCDHSHSDFKYKVEFTVRSSPCDKEFFSVLSKNSSNDLYVMGYFSNPAVMYFPADYKKIHVAKRPDPYETKCSGAKPVPGPGLVFSEMDVKLPSAEARRRRAADDETAQAANNFSLSSEKFHPIIRLPVDSIYLLIVKITPVEPVPSGQSINVTVRVEWKSRYGYLAAIDWPLLPFYGVMCGIYALYGVAWLVMSACQWRDLLRVQYWIGAVIVLGMLEKAVFYVEYQSMNAYGTSVEGAIHFAEIVSCLKKTLARMLVIIVSVGFGVVKPRLGSTLHKVVGVGFVYFILCSIEAVVRASKVQHDSQKQKQLVALPLTLLEVGICWWIFTALVNTTRALRLRRNEVKLSLYRHFTNTLIFAVLASVVFMAWSLIMHIFTTCLKDWTELWIDVAFWHILFSVILLVIMILWRPTNNNQRYAFSPLLDNDEDNDDDEDTVFSGAFTNTEAMKLRMGGQQTKAESRRSRDKDTSLEDELKWVDEHIPSSLADKALPALVDSDEELQKTKFEISKMQ